MRTHRLGDARRKLTLNSSILICLLSLLSSLGLDEHLPLTSLHLVSVVGGAISSEADAHPLLSAGARPCQRCHAEISAQWSRSAHRHASLNNPYYAPPAQELAMKRGLSGEEGVLFCARCHDPALVDLDAQRVITFEVDERLSEDRDPARAGVGCLLCHSIREAPDSRGNGLYQLNLTSWSQRGAAHRERFAPATLRTPTLCATCHKASLSAAFTGDRWHRGQDDADQWSQSGWADVDPIRPLSEMASRATCQGCHMPRVRATLREDAADAQGYVRSHAFYGANATLASYRGDQHHVDGTARFVRQSVALWMTQGPVSQADDAITVDLIIYNQGAGHRIPAGVNDTNEVWLAVEAWDDAGLLIASSGSLSDLNEPPLHISSLQSLSSVPSSPPLTSAALPANTHTFRAQAVDQTGAPLARRDVTAQRSVIFDSSLHPFEPRVVRVTLPAQAALVRSRVMLRQHDARYLDYACGSLSHIERTRCRRQPTLTLANTTRSITELSARSHSWSGATWGDSISQDHSMESSAQLPTPKRDVWPLALIYPLALSSAGVEQVRRADELWRDLPRDLQLSPRGLLVKMLIASALGQTDEVSRLAQRLESPIYRLSPRDLPARHWVEASSALSAFRTAQAITPLQTIWTLNPRHRSTARSLAAAWGALGEPKRSLYYAQELIRLDVESAEGWRLRSIAERALGRPVAERKRSEARWLTYRVDYARRDELRRAWQERAALDGEVPPLLDDLPHYDLRSTQ